MQPAELDATKQELIAEMIAEAAAAPFGPVRVRVEEEDEGGPTPTQRKTSLGKLLEKKATAATLSPAQIAEAEMTIYPQEMVIDRDDLPSWWKSNQAWFPLMAKSARKYLCKCATSAPPKCVFSTAGAVVTHAAVC